MKQKLLWTFVVCGAILVFFQNCSKTQFTEAASKASSSTVAGCPFGGAVLANGQSRIAYLTSTVPTGQSCQSENRVCTNNILSGSYLYTFCAPSATASCLWNGATIAHGYSVNAYASSTVPFGQTCQALQRVCNNGSFTGTGDFPNCAPGGAASCLLAGETIPSGTSRNAYALPFVHAWETCVPTMRTCNNGVLSGSGDFLACAPRSPWYNFSSDNQQSCQNMVMQVLGVSNSCSIGGACSNSPNCAGNPIPGPGCPSSNPSSWGACIFKNTQ